MRKKKTVKLWGELFEPTPSCYGKYPWRDKLLARKYKRIKPIPR